MASSLSWLIDTDLSCSIQTAIAAELLPAQLCERGDDKRVETTLLCPDHGVDAARRSARLVRAAASDIDRAHGREAQSRDRSFSPARPGSLIAW
jgi:hypothetical protein